MKKILVAIDSCETTTAASPIMEKSTEIAQAFSSKVWLVHVVPPSREAPYNVDAQVSRNEAAAELHHEHEYLQYLAKCLQDRDIDASALLVQGSITGSLLKESERLGIDLVIVGCHKHGKLYGALMDATEEGLLSKCSKPIMFIPNE